MPTGGLDVAAGSLLAEGLGATAAGIVGDAALGAEIGGGLGGIESAIGGKNIGKGILSGAEMGGLTGGAGGAIGAAYDASGITTGIGDALSSAGNTVSDAYHGLVGGSSSSITDAANGATSGATNAISGGASSAPRISASAAPEIASNQISTQLGGSGADALGARPNLGSVNLSGPWDSADATAAAATGGGPFSAAGNVAQSAAPAAASSGISKLSQALPLGNLAYQAISGPAKLPSSSNALTAGGAATAPLLATEQANLGEAASGQLTAPQQANITQFVTASQNQLIQQLANSGVTDFKNDSRYLQGMQDIQTKALAQQQQYIQDAITAGVSAGGAASGNIAAVANQQIAQDKEFQDALSAAFADLGSSAGGQQNKSA